MWFALSLSLSLSFSHLYDRCADDDSWRTAAQDASPVAYPSKDSDCYQNCLLSTVARVRMIACRATGPWQSSFSFSSRTYEADYFIDVPHCLLRRRLSPISELLSVAWKKWNDRKADGNANKLQRSPSRSTRGIENWLHYEAQSREMDDPALFHTRIIVILEHWLNIVNVMIRIVHRYAYLNKQQCDNPPRKNVASKIARRNKKRGMELSKQISLDYGRTCVRVFDSAYMY